MCTHFSENVEKIILFGSYATKEEQEESDLDVCFVVQQKTQAFEKKLDQFEDAFYAKYLCHLSSYVLSMQAYQQEKTAIVKEIKAEGKELWSKQKK